MTVFTPLLVNLMNIVFICSKVVRQLKWLPWIVVEICSKVVTSGYPDILILVQVGFQDWYNDKPRIWVQVWTAC